MECDLLPVPTLAIKMLLPLYSFSLKHLALKNLLTLQLIYQYAKAMNKLHYNQ